MDAAIQLYIDRLDDLRSKVKETIQGMGPAELNWAPLASDTNSPYVLATHLSGSERMWIHQIVGGRDASRDRDAEFRVAGDTVGPLVEALDKTGAITREVLSGLTNKDLDQARTIPARTGPRQVTARYCILQMLEHMAEHVGHLGLTRQLYAARKG